MNVKELFRSRGLEEPYQRAKMDLTFFRRLFSNDLSNRLIFLHGILYTQEFINHAKAEGGVKDE